MLQLRLVTRSAARFAPSWPSVEPVQVLSSLPSVPLEALLDRPVEPCLVLGFRVPFPLQSLEDLLGDSYPCKEHPALMMYSPSGVFSSYPIDREVVQHGDGLRFADGSEERPAHAPGLEKSLQGPRGAPNGGLSRGGGTHEGGGPMRHPAACFLGRVSSRHKVQPREISHEVLQARLPKAATPWTQRQ